ncbi:ribosomal protein L23 [Desulfocapsa sulfexigens DSM 10523]|uniref:Large ribosomal subunit protein uL23 n=1 Tax=Desulfocapsa sulfexigens (strain DSM 10523 / SB164P1) TaxID=1167006 RepID=M1P534_DESSD|nr:50S ribosomal protein L23 [Desulfocapsa sulfexigens]AGF78593.1 ribosomal protein L23 [Desulfocapsa sulfexigens DSM 10523]
MINDHRILRGPLLTEKANIQLDVDGKVVFKVDPKANKIEIKKAVEKMFDVKVKHVHTTNMHGKQKRVGRFTGFTNDWKKAYVTLSEGEINFADQL